MENFWYRSDTPGYLVRLLEGHNINIEFKLDGFAEGALKQIEDQQYALPYLNDSRTVHKIGVNISSKTRTVQDWKVL